jgi:MATE family multidrug resistance protein
MAFTLRVSFLLGAGAPERARLLARSALCLALAIALIYMPMILLMRNPIVGLYTSDQQVQAIAVYLLMFGAFFQVADVLQVAAINALRGYCDTRIPMLIVLLSFWVVAMPLGYLLTFTELFGFTMGAAGFWIALIVGLSIASILLSWRLMRVSRN